MFRRVSALLVATLMTASSNGAADAFASSSLSASADPNAGGNGEVPQLPPSDPNSNLPTIRLGETIRLEEMGPIILNTDGSTRRIENWDTLTEREKEVTWRRISKRNEERRQALLRLQEESEAQQATGDSESKEL